MGAAASVTGTRQRRRRHGGEQVSAMGKYSRTFLPGRLLVDEREARESYVGLRAGLAEVTLHLSRAEVCPAGFDEA